MQTPETLYRAKRLYSELTRYRRLFLLLLALSTPLALLADVAIGPSRIGLGEVIRVILGRSPSGVDSVIVWSVRLPVALTALAVGAALGLAGAVMQTILDNPLASPYTLGVSAGAAFGAALVYVFGAAILPSMGLLVVPLNALVFALITCAAVYLLGRLRGFSAEALVLAGIAVNYLFHALLALLEYLASEETLQAIVFWIFGSLYKTTWEKLSIVVVALAASLVVLLPNAWRLTAMRLGDEAAETLGVNVKLLRALAFLTASLLTSVVVCFYGIIGFVGLVAPHIARMLVGEDQRYLLPGSALAGALILSLSSIASKTVSPGAIIPIGIITSFIGVPFFLAIMATRRRRFW